MKTCFTAITISIALAGCAPKNITLGPLGQQFNYKDRKNLEIGTTTTTEAISLMGEPHIRRISSTDDGIFEYIQYTYARPNPNPATRTSVLEFKNSILNAKSYDSAFEEDSTEFNFEESSKIVIGSSTMDEAINLLGEPAGSAVCPSVIEFASELCKSNGASSVVRWLSYPKNDESNSNTQHSKKQVALAVSGKNIVIDMDRTNK